MNIQPIDIPSLLRALVWPLLAIVVLTVFRRPLGDLVGVLGQRVRKLSFGGVSLELAEVSEMKPPQALDTEIRQLDAGLIPQSGVTGLTGLLNQLQYRGKHDYIVIDLGSETSPRWLTSRLYLLAFLIMLIDRPLGLVFVETVSGIRKRFLGLASPDQVRWALSRNCNWLESTGAASYAIVGGLQCNLALPYGLQLNATMNFQFDPATGFLSDFQLSQLVQQFLTLIRAPQPAPVSPAPNADDWVTLSGGMSEHAKWLDGSRIERLLGSDLNTYYVVLLPN